MRGVPPRKRGNEGKNSRDPMLAFKTSKGDGGDCSKDLEIALSVA